MISVVIPAYNEESAIGKVLERVKKTVPDAEVIVVDDGSSDKTYDIAKSYGVKVIKHAENMGKAAALRTGYNNASYDTIITIDADLSYPPEDIPKLLRKMGEGYDMVVGSRFWDSNPNSFPWFRKFANILGAKVTSVIVGRRVTDVTSGMRALKKGIAMLNVKAVGLDYEAELTSKAIKKGYRYGEVKINFEERVGRSKLRFFRDCIRFFIAVLRGKFSP